MSLILLHKETKEYAYPLSRKEIFLKLESLDTMVDSVDVIYWKRFREATRKSKAMKSLIQGGPNRYFVGQIAFDDTLRYFQYVFEVTSQGRICYFSPLGITESFPTKPFEYEGVLPDETFVTPEAFHGRVGYQIFPDRFFNGNPANDPAGTVAWESKPTRDNFFGGDLKGIQDKIPYLASLGIQTLFLTPIFEAKSNHKYDTIDYFKIDPSFGTIEDFHRLVTALHAKGIKLVLDGVFNHIGFYSKPFQDALRNGRESPYWDWFFIKGEAIDPIRVNYECVGDYKWMPKLNTSNPATQDYLLSVALYWLLQGADGWRLDVGDELASSFRRRLRQEIKRSYPEALILAETWHDGEDLLRGDQADTLMNYRLLDALVALLGEKPIDNTTFEQQISAVYFDYQSPAHPVLYNLIDSHDTERFLTTLKGDKKRLKIAAAFQFLLPGMPVIFYGDEIGMSGENDPDCRGAMKWEQIDWDLQGYYKKLAQLKNNHEALKKGDFAFVRTTGKSIAFLRKSPKENLLIVINPTPERETLTFSNLISAEGGQKAPFSLDILPEDYVVKNL